MHFYNCVCVGGGGGGGEMRDLGRQEGQDVHGRQEYTGQEMG